MPPVNSPKPKIFAEITVPYADHWRNFYVVSHSDVTYSRPHSHTYFELELVLDGEGVISINGTEYPLCTGTLHIADPTDIHIITAAVPLKLMTLKFFNSTESAKIIIGSRQRWFKLTEADAKKAEALLGVIEAEEFVTVADGIAEACFESVLKLVKRYLSNTQIDSAVLSSLRFIHENYSENITVPDVANTVGYSSAHLSKLFHEQVGVGIKSYLTTLRIDCARKLLATTELCAVDIAVEVGFGSYCAFLRSFTKMVGISPAEYRVRTHNQ